MDEVSRVCKLGSSHLTVVVVLARCNLSFLPAMEAMEQGTDCGMLVHGIFPAGTGHHAHSFLALRSFEPYDHSYFVSLLCDHDTQLLSQSCVH